MFVYVFSVFSEGSAGCILTAGLHLRVLACKPQITALYKISVQALIFVHLLIPVFLMFTGLYKTDFYFQSSDIPVPLSPSFFQQVDTVA